MPSRWDIERAIRQSPEPFRKRKKTRKRPPPDGRYGLLPSDRLILLMLLTATDRGGTTIAKEHGPSLSTLTRWTGLDEATVKRGLNRVERLGWVVRQRPLPEAARRDHARTQYALFLPSEVGAPSSPAGRATPPELGAPHPASWAHHAPGAGRTMRDKSESDQTDQNQSQNDEIDDEINGILEMIISEVRARTGKTISARHARRHLERKLAATGAVHDLRAWLAKVLANNPAEWLPTDLPPTLQQQREEERRRIQGES